MNLLMEAKCLSGLLFVSDLRGSAGSLGRSDTVATPFPEAKPPIVLPRCEEPAPRGWPIRDIVQKRWQAASVGASGTAPRTQTATRPEHKYILRATLRR